MSPTLSGLPVTVKSYWKGLEPIFFAKESWRRGHLRPILLLPTRSLAGVMLFLFPLPMGETGAFPEGCVERLSVPGSCRHAMGSHHLSRHLKARSRPVCHLSSSTGV